MSKRKYKSLVSPHKIPSVHDVVLRQFDCRQCGKHVKVVEENDKRTVFCDVTCERKYWRHAYRRKHDGNLGMSSPVSLGRFIQQEAEALR